MANTTKPMSTEDANNVVKYASVDEIKGVQITGFIQAKVGHRIEISAVNEIQTVSYFDDTALLMTLELTYTDNTLETLVSAERIA